MAVTSEEVAGVFPVMVQRFDPSKAANVNATIQFDLSGDNGGQYWLRIGDGKAETGTGQAESPRMTLKASADDFINMMRGALNPMQAFMTGKIKIQGDTNLAMKLMPLINS
ncbi:MAG: SCP2 sterol-binding domain-containing protein [Anaerolineae bacterium]|nr:SCP2 sterol-binding domain-containing protein [Anaerolineae bacterium]